MVEAEQQRRGQDHADDRDPEQGGVGVIDPKEGRQPAEGLPPAAVLGLDTPEEIADREQSVGADQARVLVGGDQEGDQVD